MASKPPHSNDDLEAKHTNSERLSPLPPGVQVPISHPIPVGVPPTLAHIYYPPTPRNRHGDVSLGGANPRLAKTIQREDLPPSKSTIVLKIGSSSVLSADGKYVPLYLASLRSSVASHLSHMVNPFMSCLVIARLIHRT